MTTAPQIVYVVDDDAAVRKSLARLLCSVGLAAETFASAGEFMAQHQSGAPGCLVLDVSMPGINGLELQQWLARSENPLPTIFITGQGDIPTSVRAMKAGAVDFLTKPLDAQQLLSAIAAALERDRQARILRAELATARERLARLTPREREVLEQVVAGKLNKQIAAELGTVIQTIKVHRARVMSKMEAESLVELAHLAAVAGIGPGVAGQDRAAAATPFTPVAAKAT